jgi:hypothetical protein
MFVVQTMASVSLAYCAFGHGAIAYHPPAATFSACFTVVSLCGLRG